MNGRDGHDPLAALNLPRAIFVQAGKLLQAIGEARTLADALRATVRAEGFTLGLQAARALSPMSIEVLYQGFETASQARQLELEQ